MVAGGAGGTPFSQFGNRCSAEPDGAEQKMHAGRCSATTGAQLQGEDDPFLIAATRVIESIRAVLSRYGIQPDELDHAGAHARLHGPRLYIAPGRQRLSVAQRPG